MPPIIVALLSGKQIEVPQENESSKTARDIMREVREKLGEDIDPYDDLLLLQSDGKQLGADDSVPGDALLTAVVAAGRADVWEKCMYETLGGDDCGPW